MRPAAGAVHRGASGGEDGASLVVPKAAARGRRGEGRCVERRLVVEVRQQKRNVLTKREVVGGQHRRVQKYCVQFVTEFAIHAGTAVRSKSSVPARPISEGAAPCPYWLVPCPIYTRPARIKKLFK